MQVKERGGKQGELINNSTRKDTDFLMINTDPYNNHTENSLETPSFSLHRPASLIVTEGNISCALWAKGYRPVDRPTVLLFTVACPTAPTLGAGFRAGDLRAILCTGLRP